MKKKLLVIFMMFTFVLTGCAGASQDNGAASGTSAEMATAKPTLTPYPEPAIVKNGYVHGDDGYFNLEDEVPIHMRAQEGGTCWLYAASLAMETGYEMKHKKEVEIDPMSLLEYCYGENKKEGFFVEGADPKDFGGFSAVVVSALSNGFDKYVLDNAVILREDNPDTIKEYVKKYGALYIAIPDREPSKDGYYDGYTTKNWVTDDQEDYDHAVALVGWDDHFPKEYFKTEASQDGAWITFNSRSNNEYFYISYDTHFDFFPDGDSPTAMSITDEYSDVASYDCGYDKEHSIKKDGKITTANVFHKSGTLAAVGTYSVAKDQDIKIQIYDADFKKCLYTQEAHMDEEGYYTIPLDKPIEVKDYAIAITYNDIAPTEGKGNKVEKIRFKTTSKKGESFVKIGKKWYDIYEKSTLKKLKIKFPLRNCAIKGLYK